MISRLVIACLACAALAPAAAAHDIWLTLPGGERVPQLHIHYGHPDDLEMPQVDKVVDLRAETGAGARVILAKLTPSRTEPVLVSDPLPSLGAALLSARYDNGFWVKAPDGQYRNTTRRLVPEATEAIASVKFAKLVTGAGAPFGAVLGHELEIVPLTDPAAARPGDTLKVRVLFRGTPVAGAEVTRSDGETALAHDRLPVFRADAAGIASVPVDKAGGEVLSVTRRVSPSATPALADADTYSATLAFTLDAPRTN